ncbi:MFS transporter [Elizabethkingia argentiflava]|uniref:MFS transporter n=1 Tax=Elizabethkingia argenteiflava TaxID=2681556 RepID=A0A845PSV5_9FLAO|nr:MFS transporter [Elizabethkingia argenteiflava]NAW50113.1 MFS transporter [Elizabethkingia argenteiflava]
MQSTRAMSQQTQVQKTIYVILFMISFSHLFNDLMQSIIPSVYPVIKEKYHFSFTQIGIITFTFQCTASILQPFIGAYTDKKPKPFSLMLAMSFTLIGLITLAYASSFYFFLIAVALVGLGSSVFHPEASRVAYLASGGKKGLAQSIFQVGGNTGTALGPLLAALVIISYGQISILWFGIIPMIGMPVLFFIGKWYRNRLELRKNNLSNIVLEAAPELSRRRVKLSIGILLILVFSKYIYMSSMTNYYTFFLIDKFGLSIRESQYYLFAFLFAVALGTIIGGPLGDRFGRKYVIWFSILGAAPFALLLPYASFFWTVVLAIIIGFVLASAFSAILVFATDLMPGKTGTIAGLFFGFMFGIAGMGAAVLGKVADLTSIAYVFKLCAFLPLIGVITVFLPNVNKAVS